MVRISLLDHDVYSMLSLFSFQALEKLDLNILEFWFFYRIVYPGVVLDFFFQICIDSQMNVFSNSNCSMIEFLAVFFSMNFLYVVGRIHIRKECFV